PVTSLFRSPLASMSGNSLKLSIRPVRRYTLIFATPSIPPILSHPSQTSSLRLTSTLHSHQPTRNHWLRLPKLQDGLHGFSKSLVSTPTEARMQLDGPPSLLMAVRQKERRRLSCHTFVRSLNSVMKSAQPPWLP